MKTYTFCCQPSLVRAFRIATVACVALALSNLAFCGPIHDAARKGDANKVKALLQTDPKLISSKDGNGDTPLHVAALHGQVAAAQALVDAGADVNAKNNYGPFIPDDLGKVYSSSNHQDPVILLSAHGVDQRDMQNGYTPLDLAMFSVKHKELVQMLIAKGANVNAQASSGATPLFWAVMRDQKDDAQFLLDHGANVNATTAYGDTILDSALHLQYGSIIPLLVDKGADVNAKDQSERRPLTYALQMDDHKWADYLKKHGAHE
jgi:ankyrin repeat protein